MLSLSFGTEVNTELAVELQTRVETRLLELREELVEALRGERFTPHAICSCGHTLTSLEIIKGFNTDPTDYNTTCSVCGNRFRPNLTVSSALGLASVLFYCPAQTLDQIKGKEHLAPEVWKSGDTSLYRSAIYHFGGMAQAFAQLGVEYPFEELPDWQQKIGDFLGTMPDTTIAECVGQPVSVIRKIRRELGIDRFRRSDLE